jgi:hypothetical protein
VLQYQLAKWINRPLWQGKSQPGLVKTEDGWGILGFENQWLLQPKYRNEYRIVDGPESSYPKSVFARVEGRNSVHLVDFDGNWIASYEGTTDPYEAMDRVKGLDVLYVMEDGSVYSVEEGNDYMYKTDLASFAAGRFPEFDWSVSQSPKGCNGWIVHLRGVVDGNVFTQDWVVIDDRIYGVMTEKMDYIETDPPEVTQNCLA